MIRRSFLCGCGAAFGAVAIQRAALAIQGGHIEPEPRDGLAGAIEALTTLTRHESERAALIIHQLQEI